MGIVKERAGAINMAITKIKTANIPKTPASIMTMIMMMMTMVIMEKMVAVEMMINP
jgi:hypothetical protein